LFSNLFVEKRIADNLAKQTIDKEFKLELEYRILKEQLKKTK
jgi:hypothetical protein